MLPLAAASEQRLPALKRAGKSNGSRIAAQKQT